MDKVRIEIKGMDQTIESSKIIMGSASFLREDNMEEAATILDHYIALGGNTFDTARHYRYSEKALGLWMKARKNRSQIFVETKCGHPTREARTVSRVNSVGIETDLETSLDVLGTAYVDFFALHRDDPSQPVGPIMEALHRQVVDGKARAIGVSNWELARIKEAQLYIHENNLSPLSFNSPNLSLATVNQPRWKACVTANDDMKNWHEATQLPLFSWSAQAEGFFANRFSEDDLSNQEIIDVYYNQANWEKLKRVNKLAQRKKCQPIQISLAYVLNQPFPTLAVIGPENKNELELSIEASKILFTQAEMDYLNLKIDNC